MLLDRVSRHDLRREPPPAADVIVANLHRRLLVHLAGALREEPRAFIASGVLDAEADEVAGAFGPAFMERRRLTQGGWSALLLTPR